MKTRFVLHVDLDTGDVDPTELMADVEDGARAGLKSLAAHIECVDAIELDDAR